MGVQLFKGDATEVKMKSVGDPLLNLTDSALDEFYEQGFDASPFLLMLYDEGRMPFSDRINRDVFVDFIKEALDQFPVTGTFESHIFVLTAVFGAESIITFGIPVPGKLTIDILAISATPFDFIGREFVSGEYEFFNIIDGLGNTLTFRGLPGIDNEYELNLLFSEVIPAGISPTISLGFYSISDWIAEESSVFYDMKTDDGDQFIFFETGG